MVKLPIEDLWLRLEFTQFIEIQERKGCACQMRKHLPELPALNINFASRSRLASSALPPVCLQAWKKT
jgi:hypothetical protein